MPSEPFAAVADRALDAEVALGTVVVTAMRWGRREPARIPTGPTTP